MASGSPIKMLLVGDTSCQMAHFEQGLSSGGFYVARATVAVLDTKERLLKHCSPVCSW